MFLAARFLESTDYNPNHFGTYILLGDGPPAVVPHPGPGRFAARPIPARRLTVQGVRRLRGGDDGETVPRGWHVAEPVDIAIAHASDAGPRTVNIAIDDGPGPGPVWTFPECSTCSTRTGCLVVSGESRAGRARRHRAVGSVSAHQETDSDRQPFEVELPCRGLVLEADRCADHRLCDRDGPLSS